MWDAIVIGTGMGGATLGYALAKRGKRVLFCERGRMTLLSSDGLKGEYPEQQQAGSRRGDVLEAEAAALLASAGRSVDEVLDVSNSRPHRFVPFIGSGTGGSTGLYGMSLERFAAADFSPRSNHADETQSSLPDAWPIRYDAFCSYYAQAEALYRVRGTRDPLNLDHPPRYQSPPRPLSPAVAELCEFFGKAGLHPYPLPVACESLPECQSCQSVLCALECKNDSGRIGLTPALRDFGATLLTDCQVTRIEADRTRVTGVSCTWQGREVLLRGTQVFLAAGALQTPNLLLRSASADWPQGLANGSGLVGRNLMRHFIDLYLVEADRASLTAGFDNRFKEFAFNDFYRVDGVRLGSVQSFGRLPPPEMIFGTLKSELKAGALPWLAGAMSLARPVMVSFLKKMVDRSITLATIIEDLPYLENQITPDLEGPVGSVRLSYRLREPDRARIAKFRSVMRSTLKGRAFRVVKQAENNERLAHVCGTCRFGDDPQTSVLDKHNRCHELENLFVVDSSFFPSSGGTNPSLTIAANALRVADELTR